MSNQFNSISKHQLQTISPLPDVVHYVSLVNQLVEYSIVREREDTERLAIRSQAAKDITLITGKLSLLEQELLADQENLRSFVQGTMAAIPELIKHGQFELIDKLQERVANHLQGRVSRVAEAFNQSSTKDVFLLEDKGN